MRIQFSLFLLITLLVGIDVNAQQQSQQFSLGKNDFLLNGKPFQIISGELHPARIPTAYWLHRIQMAKAMGCNTIAVYVFWNYHEQQEGQFDFTSGNHNLAAFIGLCQQEGMWVLLRPGPYVCGEWDFGGLPPYLLKIPDIKIRCMDTRYMAAVNRYIDKLAAVVNPLQIHNDGPIIMVQVENEYGSFGNDKAYMQAIKNRWIRNKISVPLYTADGAAPHMLDAGSLPGMAIGLDPGNNEQDFAEAKKIQPAVPVFSSETYPGWLTHWGEAWANPDTNKLKEAVTYLLQHKKSFNFYVIHGGTNFGFTAGANAFSPTQYQPDITSYDYDAPINEQGDATPKYFLLRRLIQQYTTSLLPPVPAPVNAISIQAFHLEKQFSIWDIPVAAIKTPQPQPMENFGQNQGIVIYKTKLIGHKSGVLKIWEPHDYALVFLNGAFLDTVYRDGGNWEVQLPVTAVKDPVLEIMVEGMGHINFAQFMIDRKGITDRVTLNGMTLMNWETSLYPMDENFVEKHRGTINKQPGKSTNGIFFSGTFNLQNTGDTYFDVSGLVKGMVYVNGHNLGRYWKIGPQLRLYCPANWLHKGSNEILVFDFHQEDATIISSYKNLK